MCRDEAADVWVAYDKVNWLAAMEAAILAAAERAANPLLWMESVAGEKPTITGSRSDCSALSSLAKALDGLGIRRVDAPEIPWSSRVNDTPSSDTVEKPPPSPVDIVIDHLTQDRVGPVDRGRLDKALGGANARGASDKAKGFGHIVGRMPSGLNVLTGRD